MKKTFSSLILIALLGAQFALPAFAHAQVTDFSQVPISGSNTNNVNGTVPAGTAKTNSNSSGGREITLLAPIVGTTKSCVQVKIGTDSKTESPIYEEQCKTDFITYLKGFFKVVITFSSILAVIMITIGGFEYMLSATELGKTNGIDRIKNALIGLGLALASFLILYTINPELTRLDIIKSITPAPQTPVVDPAAIRQRQEYEAALLAEINRAKNENTGTNPTTPGSGFNFGQIDGLSVENQGKIAVIQQSTLQILADGESKVNAFIQEGATSLDIRKARAQLEAMTLASQKEAQNIDAITAVKNGEGDDIDDPAALAKAKEDSKREIIAAIAKKVVELEKKINYREKCPKDYITTKTGGTRRNPIFTSTPCVAQ